MCLGGGAYNPPPPGRDRLKERLLTLCIIFFTRTHLVLLLTVTGKISIKTDGLRYIPGQGVVGRVWFMGCILKSCETRKVSLVWAKVDENFPQSDGWLVLLEVIPGMKPYPVTELFQTDISLTNVKSMEVRLYENKFSRQPTRVLPVDVRKWPITVDELLFCCAWAVIRFNH